MYVSGVGAGTAGVSSMQGASRPAIPNQPADSTAQGLGRSSDARISRRGQFMNKLKDLAKSDPAAAKQMVADLAAKMRSDAQQGTPAGDRRLAIADRLQQAADSGDFSKLGGGGRGGDGDGDADGSGGGWQTKPTGSPATQAYAQAMAVTRSSW